MLREPRWREQVDLHPWNTLALHARARYACEPASLDELREALAFARAQQLPVLPLGEGSNVVITRDYPGVVIRLTDASVQLEHTGPHTVQVRVGAGHDWHAWVETALANGWYGLENLALIPGTVGAAPVQNIGAYGVEVSRFIDAVTVMDRATGEVRTLDNAACQFAYRDSVFKQSLREQVVITSVVFTLSTVPAVQASYAALREYLEAQGIDPVTPQAVKEAVCAVRRSRLPDPRTLPNVGSFFKNPQIDPALFTQLQQQYPAIVSYPGENGRIKLAAAWLIDQLGWKGRCLGPVCVHDQQALVLVNRHGGSGADVLALAEAIRADVQATFGVALEYEPWVW